ncbi:MAG: hypothetical protein V1799_14725 [bacterium]
MGVISDNSTVRFLYRFKFENGVEKEFDITLEGETLGLIYSDEMEKPEWTKLNFCQCDNCPLPDAVTHCPVAVNLSRLVDTFRDYVSYETAHVTVETAYRIYYKKVALQKGISSILGIYMVSSNCPVMDPLRPMVRFHLPFANSLETFFRSVSAYLVAQFLKARHGKEPDWQMKKLVDIYRAINKVNKGMSERITNAAEKDASVNAVVILHSFGDGIPYFIESGLEELEPLFWMFLKEEAADKPQ